MKRFKIPALYLLATVLGMVSFIQASFACAAFNYQPELPEELQ